MRAKMLITFHQAASGNGGRNCRRVTIVTRLLRARIWSGRSIERHDGHVDRDGDHGDRY